MRRFLALGGQTRAGERSIGTLCEQLADRDSGGH
jgi:hypothetical protein